MNYFLLLFLGGLMAISSPAHSLAIVTIEEARYFNRLKSPAQAVEFPLTAKEKKLIQQMKNKLIALGGVGLAAPQLNQNKRIAVIYIPEEAALLRDNVKPYRMHVIINPHYEGIKEGGMLADFEACYSVTTKAGKVPRYQRIRVHFTDEKGHLHHRIEKGFYARVLQHEIDHLNGILIIDRLTPDCIQGTREEMLAMRRNELSDEQKKLFDKLVKKKKLKNKG